MRKVTGPTSLELAGKKKDKSHENRNIKLKEKKSRSSSFLSTSAYTITTDFKVVFWEPTSLK